MVICIDEHVLKSIPVVTVEAAEAEALPSVPIMKAGAQFEVVENYVNHNIQPPPHFLGKALKDMQHESSKVSYSEQIDTGYWCPNGLEGVCALGQGV